MRRSLIHRAAVSLIALAAVTAFGQQDDGSCGMVYDVTVHGLRHYADADVARMTEAIVTRIVDGDTVWVRMPCPPPGPAAEEKVRLMGIDTPETGEPGADEATQFVRHSIGAGPVYLAFDFRRRDRFDRLLAYVYLSDGTLLNTRLIECGLAEPYRGELNYFSELFEQLAAGPRPDDCLPPSHPTEPSVTDVVIVEIANAGTREHVQLRNDSGSHVSVRGWSIRDDDDTHLLIPWIEPLPPGGTLALCSGSGCVGDPVPNIHVTDKNVWGNDGDAAVLCDVGGREVDRYCYKDGCSSAKPAPRCA